MLEYVNSTCLNIVTASFEVCRTRWFMYMHLILHCTVTAGCNKPNWYDMHCAALCPWRLGYWNTLWPWCKSWQMSSEQTSCNFCKDLLKWRHMQGTFCMLQQYHHLQIWMWCQAPTLYAVSGILAEVKLSNNKIANSSWHTCAWVVWCWEGKQLRFNWNLRDILIMLTVIERPSQLLWHYVELPENSRYCNLSAKSCPFIKILPASFPSILSACLPSRNTSRVGRACRQFLRFANNAIYNCQYTQHTTIKGTAKTPNKYILHSKVVDCACCAIMDSWPDAEVRVLLIVHLVTTKQCCT